MGTVPVVDAGANAPALAQVRAAAQALASDGRQEDAFEYVLAALAAVLRQTHELQVLLAKFRRAHVGKTSERLDPAQLALLLEELQRLGSPADELNAEAEARADAELTIEIGAAEQVQRERSEPKPPRGTWQTHGVERRVQRVELPAEERICATCGREKSYIGDDITRTLEFVPAHFVEHEDHREKYACGTCKRGVSTAAASAKVIERSAADASLLAHVVVSKYVDHCPLHRLHRIYARSGAVIPVSTLSDWAMAVGERILPLVDVLVERVVRAYIVRTDATGLKVLDPSSPENIELGTMWCYVGDDHDVVIRYTPTGEGASGPWDFLAGRRGYVQADAATVFDRLYNGQAAAAVEVGCWAHGRRRLVALQDSDCRVAYPLQLIARLYRIEHLARARLLGAEELRAERSQVVLDKLRRWLGATLPEEPPSSDLAKAAGYLVNQWTALTRFVGDGRLDLDNNLCEQQLRTIALGRRNFLFAGSHEAARRAAALYSLTRTSALHGVAPLPYVTDVLRKLAQGWERHRLEELLPDRWNALHNPDRALDTS